MGSCFIPSMAQMPVLSDGIRIFVHAEFFVKNSDPSHPFATREAKSAYTLRDDSLEEENFMFLWRLGKKGRLVITLQGSENDPLPLHVRHVLLRTGDGSDQPLEFVQEKDYRSRTLIKAALDASRIDCPRLHFPSPSRGDIEERYISMDIFIEVETEKDPVVVYEFVLTVFCRVIDDDVNVRLYRTKPLLQSVWTAMPQGARDMWRSMSAVRFSTRR